MKDILNYIGGKWVPAQGGETFANVNPHSGETLCQVAKSNTLDVSAAIASAQSVQESWMAKTAVERG